MNKREGVDSLAYGLLPQQGINAGMNQLGVTVISSYFDYKSHQPLMKETLTDNPYWGGDLRGIIQGEVLAKCKDADEAKMLFEHSFTNVKAPVGENHIILDNSGTIYVFEHCRGQMGLQVVTDQGYVARSNQSLLLFQEEQMKQEETIRLDRELRLQQAEHILSNLKKDEDTIKNGDVLRRLKALTSLHIGEGNHLVVLCTWYYGGKVQLLMAHDTMSALIWDINNRKMHYTIGQPCQSEWKEMQFT